jgi:hypothetical protein
VNDRPELRTAEEVALQTLVPNPFASVVAPAEGQLGDLPVVSIRAFSRRLRSMS